MEYKIKNNPYFVQFLTNEEQTEEICWLALKSDPSSIQNIHKQTTRKIRFAINKDPYLVRFIRNPNQRLGFCLEALKIKIKVIHLIKELFPNILKPIVKKFPCLLKYLSDLPNYNYLIEGVLKKYGWESLLDIIEPPKNEEFQLIAVKYDFNSIKYFKNPSGRAIISACSQAPSILELIDQKDYSIEICKTMMKHWDYDDEYKDRNYDSLHEALCDMVTMRHNLNSSNPKKLFSMIKKPNDNLVLHIINSGYFAMNKTITLDHFDDDVLISAVKKNSNWIQMISPDRFWYELCLEAVKKDGNCLDLVPSRFKDRGLCFEAIKNNPYALRLFPDDILDYKFCLEAVKLSFGSEFINHIMNHVPRRFISYEMCMLVANNCSSSQSIIYVPENYRTYELCWILGSKKVVRYDLFDYIPKNLIDEALYLHILKSNPLVIDKIPERLLTYEKCLNSVGYSGSCIFKIPEKYLDDEILLCGLRDLDIYKYDKKYLDIYKDVFNRIDFSKRALKNNPKTISFFNFNKINPICFENPFYRLWVKAVSRTSLAFSILFWNTEIIDEYSYFLSLKNGTLCQCIIKELKNNFMCGKWCGKCGGTNIETKIRKIRREQFFPKVCAIRELAYLKYAKDNRLKLNIDDTLLQNIIYLPNEIIKLIIFYQYGLDPYLASTSKKSIEILMKQMSLASGNTIYYD